jgi:DNA helicase-2/ATP-dependent DNA helicase PcrA
MTRWTPEQLDIFTEVKSTKDNLIIEALAGAAKTTTLVELAKYLEGNTLCLAFNKKIADEMQTKMPPMVRCSTLNSLGHRVWGDKLGKRLNVSSGKMHALTLEAISYAETEVQQELFENLADLSRMISASKNHGHVPDRLAQQYKSSCTPLLNDEEFYSMLPEEPTRDQMFVIDWVVSQSFELALKGMVDFADQLLMPTVMKCSFPTYSNVLGDEVQDWSELNHVMVAKVARKRIIAVGDSLQAIYAFRGAHKEGMPLLRERFNMKTLYLSTTFRCPEAICTHVRHHATRIQSWEGNPNNPGDVRYLNVWDMNDIPEGAAILCRNNAPLFRLALKMLRAGRRPNLWGRDVAAFLIKIMEKLGAPNMKRADAVLELRKYQEEKGAKLRKDSAKEALAERCECILVFIEGADTLGGAIALARNVFNEGGKTDLATGHKAKGAEWDEVFILDRHLLADEGQDLNLAYVLATRAKRRLTYIEMDGYASDVFTDSAD